MAHGPHPSKVAPKLSISEIAQEFRELDVKRRRQGLSLAEVTRYQNLCAMLSDSLASMTKHRQVDGRHFLRVPFPVFIVLRHAGGEHQTECHDFGGGGCAIVTDLPFQMHEDVWLDGAVLDGVRYPLHGRAQVVWKREATAQQRAKGAFIYGLRFVIDAPNMRDEIDRVLYRVLDVFLRDDRVHTDPTRDVLLNFSNPGVAGNSNDR